MRSAIGPIETHIARRRDLSTKGNIIRVDYEQRDTKLNYLTNCRKRGTDKEILELINFR